jgi:hypothetical protein
MAEQIVIRRRALIQGALAGAATLPAAMAVGATIPVTPHEQINHHCAEIMRLLKETAPEGLSLIDVATLTEGGIAVAVAFPEDPTVTWGGGRPSASYENGQWIMQVRGKS